ncbi:L-2-hydroxyglutarate dehydrogenase, mitochondrial [Halyomorpha halys]|uniref:L-2-hydroxyglutarate dehydrogenase, mitochondrial n=1 Tax=Halyomorpha halys TaxID=286706 RepID=UPI0006D4CE0E|nr:L-2-hydroxyglutarate dehydrogenase, mitochondrial [Halyomorpha halys]
MLSRNVLKLKNQVYLHQHWRTLKDDGWVGCYDVVIIGGGIVGMATAKRLVEKNGNVTCAVVEKENKLAYHQSGHNSGVVHAGIYYKPGSLKAKLCTEGMKAAYDYFDAKNITYKKVGKLIVATCPEEIRLLNDLYMRGARNEVPDLKMIEGDKIKDIEPACTGLRAIHSPHTGIVDWSLVTEHYGEDFKSRGGDIFLNFNVSDFHLLPESEETVDINKYPIKIVSSDGKSINAGFVLSCAGLHSDKVAVMSGGNKDPSVIPIRGEYLLLSEEKQQLIKGNIYPVPNPKFPFLGVHFTPRLDGSVWLGPNAVLAFKKEGYTYSDISLDELSSLLSNKGFQSLAYKNLKFGFDEFMKSLFINLQLKEIQKFVPSISRNDIRRGPAGVRAQVLTPEGELVDDFIFENSGPRILHCRNAPSPGATSSLSIGRVLSDKILAQIY